MNDLQESFNNFYNIIIKLRSKDGCPWDREQTADSVRTNLLEEVYECIEAISENDDFHTAEELGDILIVISMISRIKEEENAFTFKEVIERVSEKLIRRHPHVFSDTIAKTPDEGLRNWELMKKAEAASSKKNSEETKSR
ncbi:MAG: nucleoside triphosphate pyrophosphohydrolase, partial [Spirochaetaceae bacterium]|nr:nucleoside triphosphate pyrophosphohydrolase [Spirochaetaceae bacterium]